MSIDQNSDEYRTLMKQWIDQWRRTGPLLEAIRRKELREINTYDAIARLCIHAFPERTLRATSGLVDQQQWFKKAMSHD